MIFDALCLVQVMNSEKDNKVFLKNAAQTKTFYYYEGVPFADHKTFFRCLRKYPHEITSSTEKRIVLGPMKYHVCFEKKTRNIDPGGIGTFDWGLFFCNFRVYNATYAKLKVDSMVSIPFTRSKKGFLELPDFTSENPFMSLYVNIHLETDGDKFSYVTYNVHFDVIECMSLKYCIHLPSHKVWLLFGQNLSKVVPEKELKH